MSAPAMTADERAECAPYTRDLTKALRPKYGPTYAPLLAKAFVDFTNDRPGDALGGDERLAYLVDARARFHQRAGRIKAAWAKGAEWPKREREARP